MATPALGHAAAPRGGFLVYGRDDRFARAHSLLAPALPHEQVLTRSGGHDWDTWTPLWGSVLKVWEARIAPSL